MKHIFVINPAAGKGKTEEIIRPQIVEYCIKNNVDYEIFVSPYPKSAIDFVRNKAAEGEPVRFYACGGDGTLFEVVNGCFGFENAEVASIPLGSGNDFIRLFGEKEEFLDLNAQINGIPLVIDAIRCGDKIAVNQCSMGLDAEICAKQASFKKLPGMKAESAYYAALLYCFLRKIKNEFTIQTEGEEERKLTVLFCLCANSRWYGGGFMGAPLAIPDDGLLDFVIVRKEVSRAKMLGLVDQYKKGQHLSLPFTEFKRGKKITVKSEKPAAVNIDGEVEIVTESTFEIVPKSVKFVIPSTSTYFDRVKSGEINPDTPLPVEE